ncbi:arsenite efflux ATP-binding protein ArsA [Alkalispirochaeta americana]|uniref:arsenite-transporting ATPase n=1 Tax=Alkalispirochaeta americana TaxID=159291 RepID=A0A1N6SIR2_9SPIO|nr:TRC40/GET3/ArsA family transport-energizing ATPase [Alkalispirochaeta americana]SIQ40826.1 arsenite efflux ATP-binding protein ArsA [Alkalispirochaeta americana]
MTKNDTHYIFFSGKGGVGKTTMACATAVHNAQEGNRTLIVTTDPASNLSDVFETEIGHNIRPLGKSRGIDNLWGMEIDPDRATEEYRERILAPMRAVMPENVMKVMEEQFNSPCTTEIASFDRFVDFMSGDDASRAAPGEDGSPGGSAGAAWDVVIFDTAPTGHTLRLLELPVDWSKHIEESARGSGNTCIGPVASIQENKAKYDEATRLLGDPTRTEFTFVLQPEETSIYETRRSSSELAEIGVANTRLIVNGILPEAVCEHPFFRSRYEMQQRHLQQIRSEFSVPLTFMYQRDGEIKGLAGLRHVARDLFAGQDHRPDYLLQADTTENSPESLTDSPSYEEQDSRSLLDTISPVRGKTKALFFTGKGGVGKTTVSCATAFALGRAGFKTLLLTTDPASHIGQVLEQPIGDTITPVQGAENLDAVMIDQEAAVAEYKERILADARRKYSEDMLIAVKEELESPCTEEMAAFDKFMWYVEREEYDLVVFDTAPTGHTLRLLELPFDYADQVGMMVTTTGEGNTAKSETQARFDRIIAQMKDPDRSAFGFVVYPESTPVIEAYRAMVDLRAAGIETQFVVANQVLQKEYCTNDFFRKRRTMQEKYLGKINQRFQLPVTIMPLFETEITGLAMVERAADSLLAGSLQSGTAGDGTRVKTKTVAGG